MNVENLGNEAMIPKGVRDFLPINAVKIHYIQEMLHKTFKAWGYQTIIPPSLEFLSVLERGLGSDLHGCTQRFDDRHSGELLAFPSDITPQIARIFATRMHEAPLPQRLSYSGRVLRHTEQQAGKNREIFQSGVEMIGSVTPSADAEMITMALECLQQLNAPGYTIDIGQVEFYRGVLQGLGLTARQNAVIEQHLLHKDSSSLKVEMEHLDISSKQADELLALPRLFGGRDVLERAAKVVSNERSKRALDNLHQVIRILELYQVDQHITLDLGELRGLDYYSGVTFQGFLSGFGEAICLGGRYDELTASYGRPAPATGFAFNLLNLLFAMPDTLEQAAHPGVDILINAAEQHDSTAYNLAQQLRNHGLSVCTHLGTEPDPQQLRKFHCRTLISIDKDGEKARILSLKTKQTRQSTVTALLSDPVDM
ncbi:MAG: ATP phosphoribosyltransferase regulatory subunit [Desulfuromonadaceae bacterium]|nr:ATP phosphoribosyltransferase regulatory subunit [Desulfuromonadaceae bacterium]